MRCGLAAVLLIVAIGACSQPPRDPLQLDRNLLTVHNTSSEDWADVAIWLNHHFRVTTPRIEANSYFRVPLDAFVEAYGRRFVFNQMQITDLRLTAKRPGGEAFELKKAFEKTGLAGALEGVGGRK